MNAIAEKTVAYQNNVKMNYAPAFYHKLLDYRVTEILLGTLVFGAILFLRLHR